MPTSTDSPPQTENLLGDIPSLIKKTFPIPKRFAGALPSDIAELSHLLTNQRGDRALSYLGRPNLLSAYLYYFLPWNLYRLCLLIPRLTLNLSANNTITDLGCGPLTFASALWLSRPDLRSVPLEFFCIDRSSPALEAGNKFFSALSEGKSLWNIHLLREDIDFRQANIRRKIKPASLVCAVNVFNEIYETLPHNNIEGLRRMSANAAQLLRSLSTDDGCLLTVEPGVPQSGHFISFLRESLLKLNIFPVSPCTHTQNCPLSKKNASRSAKWCHFAFEPQPSPKGEGSPLDAPNAPEELLRLSAAAGLPKERLAFSFLLTGKKCASITAKTENDKPQNFTKHASSSVRVISDAFPLPANRYGRYGCCAQGLVLLTGDKSRMEKTASLSLVTPIFSANKERDKKSGALIAEVK